MRFMGKQVQGSSVLLGVLVSLAACVLPWVSNVVSPLVASIRNVIGGVKGNA